MYNYTPISKLYIRNFRNLGDVELSFEKSPIITLVGENEAGKTSVIKSFATCALNADPKSQKDCIRDGTKMFGVCIELQDGTRITRIKELTGINSYQITDASGKMLFSTNKLSEGLPLEVQKLMGLIAEPETGEFLHIRTYEDKLLFVVTPLSTNYKVMYNALKVEQLTKAIKNGSNEVNILKGAINTNDMSIQTLSGQIRGIRIVDTEPLKSVRGRLQSQMNILTKLEKLKSLVDKLHSSEEQLGALGLIDRFKLETINEVVANNVNNISRLLNKKYELGNLLSIYSKANDIEEINTSVINKISNLIEKKDNLNNKINKAGSLVQVSELSEISEVIFSQLQRINSLVNKLNADRSKLAIIDVSQCKEIEQSQIDTLTKLSRIPALVEKINASYAEEKQMTDYVIQVEEYLKQCGVAMESCPKCGEAVIFDIEKLSQLLGTAQA